MVGIFRKTLADLAILDNQGSQLCGTKDVVTHFIHSIACSVYYNTCAIFCYSSSFSELFSSNDFLLSF